VSCASPSQAPNALPVTIVGRRFEPDFDPAASGTQFTPCHAASGSVDALSAGSSCSGAAPLRTQIDWLPNPYRTAWGSGPLGLPWNGASGGYEFIPSPRTFSGFNLSQDEVTPNNQPQGWNFHVHYRRDVVGIAPGTQIHGIAFRSWRPFRCDGPLTIQRVWMWEGPANQAVTQATLLQPPPVGSTQVTTSAITLAPLARGPNNTVDFAAPRFDTYPIEVAFQVPFQYQGTNGAGDLHFWVQCSGARYEVDFAGDDNDSRYGTLVGRSLTQIGSVGYQALVGRSPIAALITEEPAPQQLQPRLQVWGEPLIGRSIELQGEAFPPNSLVVLYSGTWAPFSAAVLSCSQHVVSVGSSFWAVSDAEGHVRWDLQSGSTNPVFALNPALLGQVVGLQAVVPSTLALSSALRLGIGGGL
jgi:hypothetical protein